MLVAFLRAVVRPSTTNPDPSVSIMCSVSEAVLTLGACVSGCQVGALTSTGTRGGCLVPCEAYG
jgi:hypothetical protein